jgi:hypothetical protein
VPKYGGVLFSKGESCEFSILFTSIHLSHGLDHQALGSYSSWSHADIFVQRRSTSCLVYPFKKYACSCTDMSAGEHTLPTPDSLKLIYTELYQRYAIVGGRGDGLCERVGGYFPRFQTALPVSPLYVYRLTNTVSSIRLPAAVDSCKLRSAHMGISGCIAARAHVLPRVFGDQSISVLATPAATGFALTLHTP